MALSILYLDTVKAQGMLLLKKSFLSLLSCSFFEQHIYSIYAQREKINAQCFVL